MLDVVGPIIIQILFGQHSLFIEETLGECVVFLLDSFRFSFSNSHIQTGWALLYGLGSRCLLAGDWGYAAPLARGDLHELVEQNLVILIDGYVLLIGQKLFCLFSIISILLEHLTNLLCLLYGLISSGNLAHLALMHQLLSVAFLGQ